MPKQIILNAEQLAAIAAGALQAYEQQAPGRSPQSTPNRKRDLAVFVSRFNTTTGEPRDSWAKIHEMFGGSRQSNNLRVRRVLAFIDQYQYAQEAQDESHKSE